MGTQNQNNPIKKLVTLMGVTSASILFGLPALALINSNSSSFDGSLNKGNLRTESTHRSRQLLAQATSGTGQTNTGQTNTGQTGTGQTNTGQTGTGGTGTGQTNTGQTGTGRTGTGQMGIDQTLSFEQLMRTGYAATQQRDYPTAIAYFQRALQLRPGNPYATRAISNVQGYMQRGMQGGTPTAPTNQGGTTTAPTNQGGTTTAPTNQGGTTTAPTNQGGTTTAPTNQGGTTTAPTNQNNP